MNPKRMKLIIDSVLENVPMIGYAVNKICSVIPMSQVETYQTELCVVEACNNVIEHAYQNEPDHQVEVVVSLFSNRIVFEICDTGRPLIKRPSSTFHFDPNDTENLPEGGMGLFLMKNLMSEINYTSVNGKNILTMSKSLDTSS